MNQTEQPTINPEDNEVLRYILSDVMTIPSTHQQLIQVGARFVDRETNTSEIEVRPQREEMRTDIKHTHSRGVQVPTSHSNLSSHDVDIVGGSPARPHIPDIMPQLDGPTSVCTRRRSVKEFSWRTATMPRGGYPDGSDSDSHDNRRSHDEQRHSGRRRHHDRGGRPPDRKGDQERGYSRSGRPPDRRPPDDREPSDDGGALDDGGPPDNDGPPDDGGSPDDGRPPDDGGPPGNGRPPRWPGRWGPPGLPGPPGPVHPIIVQQPQVTIDTTALENTFGTVG